jgi:uncharacterized protein with predicted RNA binding PUA domain
MEDRLLRMVRVIADYQFGRGAGKTLFPDSCKFVLSPTTGKIRQINSSGSYISCHQKAKLPLPHLVKHYFSGSLG